MPSDSQGLQWFRDSVQSLFGTVTAEKRRIGVTVAVVDATPRSTDKAVRDLRSADSNLSNRHEKEKGVNVQVLVRSRLLSEEEIRIHTLVVISCNEGRREVVSIQTIANKQIDRTFVFDKVR